MIEKVYFVEEYENMISIVIFRNEKFCEVLLGCKKVIAIFGKQFWRSKS